MADDIRLPGSLHHKFVSSFGVYKVSQNILVSTVFESTEILVVVHDADFSTHITLKLYTNLMTDMVHVKWKNVVYFE